ncbi:ninjurin-1-like isoform X4 [Venturia canescens]|uniref:ninjurin-1-like isoform X4 n=1 Tax=Venturia canescens TaxID=32260 RepID=UPI001C9CE762|nr:ninjurin-1-like isoform X4 [Venturia canescens]
MAGISIAPIFSENGMTNQRKPENINVYATKKTIAQGMLDVALLAANATQLKNLLVVGEAYQFYIFTLTLVCLSIALQIISGLLSLSLNFMRDRKMEDVRYSASIDWIGTARVALSFTVFLINIIITVFDPIGSHVVQSYAASEL